MVIVDVETAHHILGGKVDLCVARISLAVYEEKIALRKAEADPLDVLRDLRHYPLGSAQVRATRAACGLVFCVRLGVVGL